MEPLILLSLVPVCLGLAIYMRVREYGNGYRIERHVTPGPEIQFYVYKALGDVIIHNWSWRHEYSRPWREDCEAYIRKAVALRDGPDLIKSGPRVSDILPYEIYDIRTDEYLNTVTGKRRNVTWQK